MTTERIDYLIDDSGAGMRTDYSQKWITSINLTDFLNMTLGGEKPSYDELSISGYRQRIYEYVYTRYKDVA